MHSSGNTRIAFLAVLLVLLSVYTSMSLIAWIDSPIGTKDALIYGQVKFFPAVTICPSADPAFEKVISFNQNSTFKHAADMALKPIVHEKVYLVFK